MARLRGGNVTADDLKKMAGEEAARRVESGQRLGLGTGSTASLFLEALAVRLRTGELHDVVGVPTSLRTEEQARRLGFPLTTLDETPELDLAVDGTDEVDPRLDLIKGLGGALLREKIVAAASRRFVVVADEGKLVTRLGERSPVPVEILEFGATATRRRVTALGADAVPRLSGGQPYRTDQGNYILDCRFESIDDPPGLSRALDSIPGVLGHGMFLGVADEVIVGTPEGPETRVRG
jgi:ribose 5-phosphate isomerase A